MSLMDCRLKQTSQEKKTWADSEQNFDTNKARLHPAIELFLIVHLRIQRLDLVYRRNRKCPYFQTNWVARYLNCICRNNLHFMKTARNR